MRRSVSLFFINPDETATLLILNIDRLKIDRSFVNEVLVDSKNAAIVSTIASMAHPGLFRRNPLKTCFCANLYNWLAQDGM